ncbi:MAG: mechanosensitive ion channel family protein [Dehalococcoidales bacterium]|nr:mechanosensitive ion channel family protein [Dehalococcoidales bacterium]
MDMTYFLKVILPTIIVIVLAVVAERILSSLISRYSRTRGLPTSHAYLIKLVARWSVVVVVIIMVASIFGAGVGSLWATITGILAMVIIGFFAMWSVLSNVLATVVVLVARPFVIGDRITILPENISGKAIDINLLYGKLRTDDGQIMIVPNITFLTKFVSVASSKK